VTTPTVLQIVFAAFFSMFFSAILRRADIWFPFTPTMTHVPGRWIGFNDLIRRVFSAVFLLIAPAVYLSCVLVELSHHAQKVNLDVREATLGDAFRALVVFLMVIPPLGFYDMWQGIVRSSRWFYSGKAIAKIEEVYPNAFKSGAIAAFVEGLLCVLVPIVFWMVTFSGSDEKRSWLAPG
jgi:hypothetical protein